MASKTLTIGLEGRDVGLQEFAAAMESFKAFVDDLHNAEAPKKKIDWLINDLNIGSATATIIGHAEDGQAVERVADAYLKEGERVSWLLTHDPRPLLRPSIRGLIGILDGRVTAIRFETADGEAVISKPADVQTKPISAMIVRAHGVITGRIQTLTSRQVLRFTLYDGLHDRPVACYLKEGQQEWVRDAWDRRARVSGFISRDAVTGLPSAVRDITKIEIIEPGRYDIWAARGASPSGVGDASPEDAIRRIRDA